MTKKCFIDIETTGLNPAIHEIIEVAISSEIKLLKYESLKFLSAK